VSLRATNPESLARKKKCGEAKKLFSLRAIFSQKLRRDVGVSLEENRSAWIALTRNLERWENPALTHQRWIETRSMLRLCKA
jgi:hypothetical protein